MAEKVIWVPSETVKVTHTTYADGGQSAVTVSGDYHAKPLSRQVGFEVKASDGRIDRRELPET